MSPDLGAGCRGKPTGGIVDGGSFGGVNLVGLGDGRASEKSLYLLLGAWPWQVISSQNGVADPVDAHSEPHDIDFCLLMHWGRLPDLGSL